MNSSAIKKAARCLREARSHLTELRTLQTSPLAEQFEAEWRRFLNAIQSVPETLITGARHNPRSRQWMGQQSKAIRSDPLLEYLLQSRASSFHGADRLTTARIWPGEYKEADIDPLSESEKTDEGVWHVPSHVTRVKLWYQLMPAIDEKHGNVFDVPSEHLGEPVEDISAVGFATFSIAYYESLLREAATQPWAESRKPA